MMVLWQDQWFVWVIWDDTIPWLHNGIWRKYRLFIDLMQMTPLQGSGTFIILEKLPLCLLKKSMLWVTNIMKRISGFAVKIKIHINYYIKLSWRARRCPWKKKMKNINYFFKSIFLPITPPGYPWVSTKKCQAIRSNRLAGYNQNTYECLVLVYRYISTNRWYVNKYTNKDALYVQLHISSNY